MASIRSSKAKPIRKKKPSAPTTPDAVTQLDLLPSIPSAAVFSFLKDTRGDLTWTAHDLAEALKLSRQDAIKILTVLQLQGYVHQNSDGQQWLTTASGEIVSGSTLPRLSRESVEQDVAALADRMAAINRDQRAEFRIRKAVAFGDFLSNHPKVQAADVGVELSRRNPSNAYDPAFLKQLSRNSRFLHIRPYEKWMIERPHRNLLPPA